MELFCSVLKLLKVKREGERPEESTPATRRARQTMKMARESRMKVTMLDRFRSALGKGGWWEGSCCGREF